MNKRKLLRQQSARRQHNSQPAEQKQVTERLVTLAARALAAQKPSEADDWCRRILSLTPENGDALNLRGLAAAQLGHSGIAEMLMRQALAVQPDNPAFNCNLGILLANQGKSGEALRCQPDNVEVLYNLIELYEKTNQLPLAVEKTKQALTLAPDLHHLRYQLAKLEYRLGNYHHARDIVTGLLARKLDHDLTQRALHLLGQVSDRLGEYNQAFVAFQRTNELLALSPLARNLEPQRREIVDFITRQRDSFIRDCI